MMDRMREALAREGSVEEAARQLIGFTMNSDRTTLSIRTFCFEPTRKCSNNSNG